jgi:hypothetical protein
MAGAQHYTRLELRIVAYLSGFVLCGVAGCWQEVHYTGPAGAGSGGAPASRTTAPADFAGEAGGFGDDLVAALADSPSSPQHSDTSVRPAASMSGKERSIAGDRYPSAASDDAATNLNQGFLGAEYGLGRNDASPAGQPQAPTAETPTSAFPPTALREPTSPPVAANQPESVPTAPTNPIRAGEQIPPTANLDAKSRGQNAAAITRRAAWQLGSKWTLAALARDRGAATDNVAKWLEQANTLARYLGTSLSQLPAPLSDREVSSRAMVRHVFAEGLRLGRHLSERYGPDHAALFELGVKSSLLLVLYEPKTPVAETLAASIAKARELAGSPAELWQPLLDAIAEGRDAGAVRQIVFQLHDEVDRSLAGTTER